MDANDYWFFLKPYIYVKFEEKIILLYNTKNGSRIKTSFMNTISLIKDLYKPENLGVVKLDNQTLSNPNIFMFIEEVLEKQMGSIKDIIKNPLKPISLVPILNLQNDIDKLKKKDGWVSKDVMNHLLELNININNVCSQTCQYCSKYYTQTYCCTSAKPYKELSIITIESIFQQIKYASIGRINILGGNIFVYSQLNKLNELISSIKNTIYFYVHYKNYQNHNFIEQTNLILIVTFPVDISIFTETWAKVNKDNTVVWIIIENEKQYNDAEILIDRLNIHNYEIHPFYSGSNLDFFSENIFLNEDDIFSEPIPQKKIFCNQKMNSNYFGSLFIQTNGEVKASPNTATIGLIQNTKIVDIIAKEMEENTAWRKTRNSRPCITCLYQYLCPPPSNYECIIGKPNLCRINPYN